jgi:hypothetical protein
VQVDVGQQRRPRPAAWHGIGKARLAAGDPQAARQALTEAAAIARRLGDGLQLAKILRALEIMARVVELFRSAGAPFDAAHGALTSARLHAAAGELDAAGEHLHAARAIIHRHQFGLLEHLYPELTNDPAAGIATRESSKIAGSRYCAPREEPWGQTVARLLSTLVRVRVCDRVQRRERFGRRRRWLIAALLPRA